MYIPGNAIGIWICGCSLFYKRELWASKSAGAHSTKSLKISGCKRWYPKDLRVPAPAAPTLTHSLYKFVSKSVAAAVFGTFRTTGELNHFFDLPNFPRVNVWYPLSLSLFKYSIFLFWKSAICSSSCRCWSSTVFFSSVTEIFISSNRACNWKPMTYCLNIDNLLPRN